MIRELTKENLNVFSFNESAVKLYKKLGYVEQRYIFELNKGE